MKQAAVCGPRSCRVGCTAQGPAGLTARPGMLCRAMMRQALPTSTSQVAASSLRPGCSASRSRLQLQQQGVQHGRLTVAKSMENEAYMFQVEWKGDDHQIQNGQAEQTMVTRYLQLLRDSDIVNKLRSRARFERPRDRQQRRFAERMERLKWEKMQPGFVPESLASAGGDDAGRIQEPFFDFFDKRAEWDKVYDHDEANVEAQRKREEVGGYMFNRNGMIDLNMEEGVAGGYISAADYAASGALQAGAAGAAPGTYAAAAMSGGGYVDQGGSMPLLDLGQLAAVAETAQTDAAFWEQQLLIEQQRLSEAQQQQQQEAGSSEQQYLQLLQQLQQQGTADPTAQPLQQQVDYSAAAGAGAAPGWSAAAAGYALPGLSAATWQQQQQQPPPAVVVNPSLPSAALDSSMTQQPVQQPPLAATPMAYQAAQASQQGWAVQQPPAQQQPLAQQGGALGLPPLPVELELAAFGWTDLAAVQEPAGTWDVGSMQQQQQQVVQQPLPPQPVAEQQGQQQQQQQQQQQHWSVQQMPLEVQQQAGVSTPPAHPGLDAADTAAAQHSTAQQPLSETVAAAMSPAVTAAAEAEVAPSPTAAVPEASAAAASVAEPPSVTEALEPAAPAPTVAALEAPEAASAAAVRVSKQEVAAAAPVTVDEAADEPAAAAPAAFMEQAAAAALELAAAAASLAAAADHPAAAAAAAGDEAGKAKAAQPRRRTKAKKPAATAAPVPAAAAPEPSAPATKSAPQQQTVSAADLIKETQAVLAASRDSAKALDELLRAKGLLLPANGKANGHHANGSSASGITNGVANGAANDTDAGKQAGTGRSRRSQGPAKKRSAVAAR